MNIRSTLEVSKHLDDGRMDSIIELLAEVKSGNGAILSFEKTERVTAAGYAILFVVLDAVSEQKKEFEIVKHDAKRLFLPNELLSASNHAGALEGFYDIETLNIDVKNLLVYGKAFSIAPEFLQKLEQKFLSQLGEDRLWEVTLIFNELMQNSVDHSTAERYFLYAGITGDKFEFGVLDLGVSIPAKLETKYKFDNDEEYLEKAFVRGLGTRRSRTGGMGLYYLFENIKAKRGKLVILSRDAQVRKNFATRNYRSSRLKRRLSGTWCMASIPLE